ncbi:MAG TPA: acetate kinase [Candidatus Binataceae bacterium]|nr:acetate kinase [Candidatus Binataceae bacterium]
MKILVFNCGSSSLKFELLELDDSRARRGRILGRGNFERIGETHGEAVLIDSAGAQTTLDITVNDHGDAARRAIAWLEHLTSQPTLHVDATAHRVVHGGPDLVAPVLIDESVLTALEQAATFAPLHNPPALTTIRAVAERLPGTPSAVLTDTAFHRDLPDYARNYALPRELARRHRIRRYGFHGIGHAWMMQRYAELTASDPANLNLITLHLGAGCSATAIRNGKSVDTSMGLTPLEGLMMATRSGDLDPAIVSFLCRREGLDPAQVESLLNHQSGLLGVSGISRDVRDITAAADAGNSDAALALAMFSYRVKKYIGQYLAVPGRTQAIIFGGGIGEHADRIRAQICSGLDHLGISLDPVRNRAANGRESRFSSDDSAIELYVIPLDEELYIARATASLLPNPK